MILRREVFPAPDGPNIAISSPEHTWPEMAFRIVRRVLFCLASVHVLWIGLRSLLGQQLHVLIGTVHDTSRNLRTCWEGGLLEGIKIMPFSFSMIREHDDSESVFGDRFVDVKSIFTSFRLSSLCCHVRFV